MAYVLLVTNVDGHRIDGTWMNKPTAEQLLYNIGGQWDTELEQAIIHDLLESGYAYAEDGNCTAYELDES